MDNSSEIATLLSDIIRSTARRGLQADVMYVDGSHQRVDYADSTIENVTKSSEKKIGIRLIKDKRQALTTSNLPSAITPEKLLDQLEPKLQVLPVDPFCGLADEQLFYSGDTNIDHGDNSFVSQEELTDRATALWEGVMSVSGITQSSGASVVAATQSQALMTSKGFFAVYRDTRFQQSISAIAGSGTRMEEDYSADSRLFWQDLDPVETAVAEASRRALSRQNPQIMPNASGEVIIENRLAKSIINQICQAMNAALRVRGVTFLQDESSRKVANEQLTIRDDPFVYRCFSGVPFDAEGIGKKVNTPILRGRVQDWINDLSSARALNIAPSAQAVRGALSQPPQPGMSHIIVESGESISDIVADISHGMWVTELIGRGLDVVSGHYSCGAAGFRIENGQITYPCRNLTMAIDGRELLRQIRPADDVLVRGHSQIPSLYLGSMTIAGT